MEENYKLAKWLNDELSEEEQKAFEQEPDYAIYARIKKYSGVLETTPFGSEKMLESILSKPKTSVKKIPLVQHWYFRIAAILIIGLGLFFLFNVYNTTTELALNGKSHSFLLPDESEVVLNSGSEIEYSTWNWNNKRALSLVGEAFFKVAKGKKFEVNTSLGRVAVLGTEFNVKQRDKRLEVSCYEGKVSVTIPQNKIIVLTQGQRIILDKGNIKPLSLLENPEPEWMNEELAFWGEDLNAVLKELERQYNLKITHESQSDTQLFTGILPAKNLDNALQIVLAAYHLKIETRNNQAIHLIADAQ